MRDEAHKVPPEGLEMHVDRPPGGPTEIALVGRLDLETTERFDHVLRGAMAEAHDGIVIDLRRVSYLDSTGIRALILGRRAAAEHGAEVWLAPGSSHAHRILRTTGVVGYFPLLTEPSPG